MAPELTYVLRYRSMANGMRRFRKLAVGSDHDLRGADDPVICLQEETLSRRDTKALKKRNILTSAFGKSSPGRTSSPSSSSSKSPVELDLTIPENLASWMKVHEALLRRSNSLEGKLVLFAASVGCGILALVLLLLLVNNVNPNNMINELQHEQGMDAFHRLMDIGGASLSALAYVAVVLGVSLCMLTSVRAVPLDNVARS